MYSSYRSTKSIITDNDNDESNAEICNDKSEEQELEIVENEKTEDLMEICFQFTNLVTVEIDFPNIKESTLINSDSKEEVLVEV